MTAREKKNHMKKALDSNFFAELCSSSSWLAGRQGDSCGTFPALKPRGMWQLSWDPETPQHCRDFVTFYGTWEVWQGRARSIGRPLSFDQEGLSWTCIPMSECPSIGCSQNSLTVHCNILFFQRLMHGRRCNIPKQCHTFWLRLLEA